MKREKYLIPMLRVVFSLAGALVLIVSTPTHAAKLSGKSVKIGGLFGVSGVCAEWGMNGRIGSEIAMEEINAAGESERIPSK